MPTVTKPNPAIPSSWQFLEARRTYLECLKNVGFTLIKLHFIDSQGECSCHPMSSTRGTLLERLKAIRAGGAFPCSVAGKHPLESSAERSVVADIDEMEAHLDQGGGIGMVLRLKDLTQSPLRVIAYDCDRPGSGEWLKVRGIDSPWEVYGRSGKHVFGLLPDDAPDFKSDTKSLNPHRANPTTEEKPGIDIKTSGHLVIAFSPNKRLVLNGRDVSEDSCAIRAFFNDEGTIRGNLPAFDPRLLVPAISVYDSSNPSQMAREKKIDLTTILSTEKPAKEEITGPYRKLPYNERKTWARRFLVVKAQAPIGDRREKIFYRTLCTLRNRYWLSERDTFQALRDHYNPRCTDTLGKPAPLRVGKIAYMILQTNEKETYDPLQAIRDGNRRIAKVHNEIEFMVEERLRKMKAKTQRANGLRSMERVDRRGNILAGISAFIEEHCLVTDNTEDRVPFNRLRDAYQSWACQSPYESDVPRVVFGDCLNELGFGRASQRIKGKKITFVIGLILQ